MALLTNLVSYWKLDEASGTRADSVGGYNLTDNNTVTQAAGKISNAAQFTAANSEHLSNASPANLRILGDITLQAWVYLDTLPGAGAYFMVAKQGGVDDTEAENFIWSLAIDENGDFDTTHEYGAGTNEAVVFTDGNLTTGTWYHVVLRRNATTKKYDITVNGVAKTQQGYTNAPTGGTNSTLFIGRNDSTASFFMNGRMDELAVWNRRLTDAEVTQLYNGGSGLAYSSFTAASDDLIGIGLF